MKCPFCGIIPVHPYPYEPRDQCAHEVSFVRDIAPQEVLDECFDLLNITPKKNLI
jgi:hypothetical protein